MTENSANGEESRFVRERIRLDRLDTSQQVENFRGNLVLTRRIRRFAVGVEEKRGWLSRQQFRRASVLMRSENQIEKVKKNVFQFPTFALVAEFDCAPSTNTNEPKRNRNLTKIPSRKRFSTDRSQQTFSVVKNFVAFAESIRILCD